MQCPICDGPLAPFIKKDFRGEFGLNVVDYWRCKACGLAISKTHFDMSDQAWEELNHACHSSVFGGDHNPMDPRWVERLSAQRDNLVHLAKEGLLLRRRPWIDYGSGDGKLADMLGENRLPTLKYDKYMALSGPGTIGDEALTQKFSVVINTSVFEHVRSVDPLDEITNLVDDDGALALHTMIREEIPNDPTWFYYLPVHTMFFTNKSMQILFQRWQFKASVYHVPSRMWFAYRNEPPGLADFVKRQRATGADDFHYKRGFVDYWK